MTNQKISAMTAATTLAAASLPIVQGGANLQAGIALFDARYGNTTVSTSDPTSSSDVNAGYYPGAQWINSLTLNEFFCISNTASAAVWRHVPRTLAFSDVAVTAPADTAVNTLATYNMPANTMGFGGELIVDQIWAINNNANAKTSRVSFGGAQFTGQALASNVTAFERTQIRNRTLSSQIGRVGGAGAGGYGATTGSLATAAISTTAAVAILITAQKATAGDTMTLEGYKISLNRPDIT